MIELFLYQMVATFGVVVFRLFQNLNSIHHRWLLMLPTTLMIALSEVYVYKAIANGGSGYSEYNSLTQFSNLRELKFISEEDYDLCYKFYGYYGESSTYNDLKAMLDCGQSIYVNPSQAKFINKYYKKV